MRSCLRRVQMNSTTNEQRSWMELSELYVSLMLACSLLCPCYLVALLCPSDLIFSSAHTGRFASLYYKTYVHELKSNMQYGCLFYPDMVTWLVALVCCSPFYHSVIHG